MSEQILYAPTILEVPAFGGETNEVKIYIEHNSTVNKEYYNNLKLIIKDNNSNIITISTSYELSNENEDKYYIFTYNLENNMTLISGEFYRFQVAYYENIDDINLLYSSVAFARYLGKDLHTFILMNPFNGFSQIIIQYNPGTVQDELLYKYQINFTITANYYYTNDKNNNNPIKSTPLCSDSSGWINFPQNANDNQIVYQLKGLVLDDDINVADNAVYQTFTTSINFNFQTINNYTKSDTLTENSDYLNIGTQDISKPTFYANRERASIQIQYNGNQPKGSIYKKSIYDSIYNKLFDIPNTEALEDFNVEHQKEYEYYYGSNEVNTGVLTKIGSCVAEFDDMFLSDANKQLKIQFNPQVSSFKETILEQKVDTIGGQYPFFYRNGNVKYKEIPISGLISYHMDDQELFMTNKKLGLASDNKREEVAAADSQELEPRSTNLTPNNFAVERKFKLAVLEWLNNGKPKLFRSPAEGNYVVRLMNVSLSPNATVGRMLHTFTATGYECMDVNDHDALVEAGVVKGVISINE